MNFSQLFPVRISTCVYSLSIYSNVRRVDLEVKKVHDIVREFFERKLDLRVK